MQTPRTIASYLRAGAAAFPHKRAFGYLEDGSTIGPECTYASLLTRVLALADYLRASGLSGHPVLLLYPEGLEFVTAFLACQEAEVVAVPMFLPRSTRHMARLGHIIADVDARVILTTSGLVNKIQTGLRDYSGFEQLHILPTDADQLAGGVPQLLTPVASRGLAFVQYTSGSTGNPKGVVISHENLLHNQALLAETFAGNAESIIFSWLPFYHDMGLIGNILHAVYLGATCLLMSPLHFMQQPMRWLKAIDRYRVTHSGGPNFCYDLCVDSDPEVAALDLSSWQVAYNGAEPVKRATMERFAAHFAGRGFHRNAFFPCYGLAEATLLVAGVKAPGAAFRSVLVERAALNQGRVTLLPEEAAADDHGTYLVSSGRVPAGMDVRILAPPTAEGTAIGEIVLAGASVSRGYWPLRSEDALTSATTEAYLPTGDLGFVHDGHLYVTGRKKELLIIRGKNYYPYDIESACATAHPALQRNAAAAVAVEVEEQEQLVVVAEVKRAFMRNLDVAAIKHSLANRVVEAVGLAPFDVVLVGPLRIPRTSSGKLQRTKCAQLYQEGAFDQERLDKKPLPVTAQWSARTALLAELKTTKDPDLVRQYLQELFRTRLHQPALELQPDDELATLGIDSVRAMELVNTLNQDLRISLEPTWVFTANTVGGLVATIEVALWVAEPQAAGQGILL
ncbi:hypothetical protein B0919_00610 [Hymenobacter sp. CRA2]|nr:AMP-binding protein [Hymenobacter sp. CRA2]OON70562.1 hypothetical protein B0919_00610 [Hymenobacter sp. CRA2]